MADYSKDLYDYKYECTRNCSAYDDGYEKGATDMEKAKQIIIDKLLEQIPKWHLCSDELPTDYENVLVDYEYFRYGDYNCMFRTVGIAYYSHEYDRWYVEGGGQQIKVHAWMELPKFEGVE